LLTLAVTVCNSAATEDPAPENMPVKEASSPPPPTVPTSHAFKFAQENELIDFSYSYPAAAAAIPSLDRQLQADLAKARSEAFGNARDDRDGAKGTDRPFHAHYFHKEWAGAGDTPRFLSLTARIETFTGGAHGNSGFQALLWDRKSNRETILGDLFHDPGSVEKLTRADYCQAIDTERLKRREGEVLEGQFSECPSYSELVVAPADEDGDGKFDSLLFLAGPYVAGPYAEGAYEISVPVSNQLLTAIKPDLRGSFEAQPQ
jgi:hypothetical protein